MRVATWCENHTITQKYFGISTDFMRVVWKSITSFVKIYSTLLSCRYCTWPMPHLSWIHTAYRAALFSYIHLHAFSCIFIQFHALTCRYTNQRTPSHSHQSTHSIHLLTSINLIHSTHTMIYNQFYLLNFIALQCHRNYLHPLTPQTSHNKLNPFSHQLHYLHFKLSALTYQFIVLHSLRTVC